MSYKDSAVLVIGADTAQINEAAPYIEVAALFFLNSATGEFCPAKLSNVDIESYDPALLTQYEAEAPRVAVLLHWWWGLFDDEVTWARQIV